MCGIAGVLHFDDRPIPGDTLDRMQAHLLPRGPDGRGHDTLGPCALIHTRLSVVDLMGGHQPMSVPARNGDGELTLTFNGEIYNHRELRRRLERLGHAFVSDHCDTEVLLHGYREWGMELPKHLHGMYAFAVWDSRKRELLLVRDRAGKKPLYLCREEGRMVFGSLIGAVTAGMRYTPTIDPTALANYLAFGYTFGQTLMKGVFELPAAHWMLVTPDGNSQTERYWRPPPLSRTSTQLGAVTAIDELINEAVSKRLEADVPLGCFLSGGVDSSLVAAIAQNQLRGERLMTFNVAMPDVKYDESPHAKVVADHIGSRHHVLIAEPHIEDDLQRLIATIGEPTADSSILPTFWLSQSARKHVTVALSGDGGDELFGGYDRYRALRMIHKHRAILKMLPVVGAGGDGKSWRSRYNRLISAARWIDQKRQYLSMIRLFPPDRVGEMGVTMGTPIDAPPNWENEKDPAEAARRWDMFHYLPFDLLRKVDRASMAVSLEVRCPLLDTQVYDLAGHLPLHVLMPGGRSKGLLKKVAEKYLPPAILQRNKAGFAVPIGRWFRGELRDLLRGHLLDQRFLTDALGCRHEALYEMILEHENRRVDHSHRLFALLTLSMWMQWLHDPRPPKPLV